MEEYLDELQRFLPIDDYDIYNYFDKLKKTISVNFDNNEYQFAYIGIHLVFMTYLFHTVWQISKFDETNYNIAAMFSRPFNGSKIDLNHVESIFEYKDLPESEIVNYLQLLGFDSDYIAVLKSQIKKRNEMAHATGTYDILELNKFDAEKDAIISIIEQCNNKICEKFISDYYIKSFYKLIKNKRKNLKAYVVVFINDYLVTENSISFSELKYISELSRNKIYRSFLNTSGRKMSILQWRKFYKAHKILKELYETDYAK